MTRLTSSKRATSTSSKRQLYIPDTYRKKQSGRNYIRRTYKWLRPYIGAVINLTLALSLLWGIFIYDPIKPSWGGYSSAKLEAFSTTQYILNYQADFFLQFIGLAAFAYIITLGTWSLHLLLNRRISYFKTRLIFFVFTSILTTFLMAKLHSILGMNALHTLTPAGWGGALGQAFLKYYNNLTFSLPTYLNYTLMTTISLLGFSLFVLSLGFSNMQIRTALSGSGKMLITLLRYLFLAVRFIAHLVFEGISRIRGQNSIPDAYEDLPPLDETTNEVADPTEAVAPKQTTQRKKSIVQSFKEKTAPKPARARASIPMSNYTPPALDLLSKPTGAVKDSSLSRKALEASSEQLMQVLNEFGVKGRLLGVKPGPVVTLYELEPAAGVKSSRIISLADDIARSMSANSARVSVIPGRNAMGIELPNTSRETVFFREILSGTDYKNNVCKLPLGLGKDIGGTPVVTDLTKMPHLLVAGTTGSGKSVGVNAMILSLLYKLSPEECKFIMIDPKMLELSVYDGIPHLLSPVVTDPKKAIVALKWVVQEMEARYRSMAQLGVRNINGYNEKLQRAKAAGETISRRVQTGFDTETGSPMFEDQQMDMTQIPYIVVVVDEMADLMLVAGKEIEAAVQRLAQMARAAGIHLIMATQRPSVDVITGTIKANFPTRISFQVTSKIDSRTILGEQGAEQLLGRGDMLYMEPGGKIQRVHGAFVADDEVERIVNELKQDGENHYVDIYSISEDSGGYDADILGNTSSGAEDELYDKALSIVLSEGKVSTSFIQRHLSIGYNRAAKIVEKMEKEGVVSAPNRVGKRDILVPHEKKR